MGACQLPVQYTRVQGGTETAKRASTRRRIHAKDWRMQPMPSLFILNLLVFQLTP